MPNLNLSPITCDLTPLVDGVTKGAGKILALIFGKKIAEREAVNRLIEANAKRKERLLIEGKGELDENGRFIEYEKIEEDNVNQCLEFAVHDASTRQEEPNIEDISLTFFYKWREHAKTIDEEYLKQFWAKVLVDEVYTPNTINLRTLNALSMLSSYEAEVFQKSMKYIAGDEYLIVDFLPTSDREHILDVLFSMGAIPEIPNRSVRIVDSFGYFKNNDYEYDFFYQQKNKLCIAFHRNRDNNNTEQNLTFQLVKLTSTGKVLYDLAYSYNEYNSISLVNEITTDMLNNKNISFISIYQMTDNVVGKEIFKKSL